MNIQSLMSPSLAALKAAVSTAEVDRADAVTSGNALEIRAATRGLELAQDLLKHAERLVANATRTVN